MTSSHARTRSLRTLAGRRGLVSVTAILMGLGVSATPAAAQVRFSDQGTDGFSAICTSNGALALPVDDNDCGLGIISTGNDYLPVIGVYTGTPDNHSFLSSDGHAEFDANVDFYKNTTFHGPVNFTGATNFQALSTSNLTNGGQLTTGGIHVTSGSQFDGPAIFNGAVNSQFLFTGLAETNRLTATGATQLQGGATVARGLNVTGGTVSDALTATTALTVGTNAVVDMGGNRVQNVAAPTAATDAANKGYVDGQVAAVAGSVSTLSTQVANQQTRITAAEAVNVQQDSRLTSVEGANAVQDTRLAAVETENGTQNTRITAVETKNVSQDARMTAIESVNTVQGNQIATLQDRVVGLQSSVTGLQRNIKEANGGIAASVALGGTMIVPDSAVSVSFNLATYRGQQGFSGSLVGRVSPKVYVNAGVGGSTVRGSTAGRVGISFGL